MTSVLYDGHAPVICRRHRRWLGIPTTPGQFDLSNTPEIITANRRRDDPVDDGPRLDMRHDAAPPRHMFGYPAPVVDTTALAAGRWAWRAAMLHTVLIGIHAALGGLALVAGIVAIRRGRLFGVFLCSLIGTIVFLAAALVVEWSGLDTTEQVIFAALAALGVYMVIRAVQAARLRPNLGRPSPAYVNHVGFNVIALFDAFVVILVLDLGAPVWLMVTAALVVAIGGHFVRRAIRDQLTPPTT
jgi:hypothetical protein